MVEKKLTDSEELQAMAAERLRTGLLPVAQASRSAITVYKRISIQANKDTGGWYAALASLWSELEVELWLDRYPGNPRRQFWVGVYANQLRSIDPLIKALPKTLKPVPPMITGQHVKKRGDIWVLMPPLKERQYGRPIFERYVSYEECFFGLFVDRPLVGRGDEFIRQAVRFVKDVAGTFNNAAASEEVERLKLLGRMARRPKQQEFSEMSTPERKCIGAPE